MGEGKEGYGASSASGVKHLVVHIKALCTHTTDANLMRTEVAKRVRHLMFLHCGSGSLDGGCKLLSRHLAAISNPFHFLLNLKRTNRIEVL